MRRHLDVAPDEPALGGHPGDGGPRLTVRRERDDLIETGADAGHPVAPCGVGRRHADGSRREPRGEPAPHRPRSPQVDRGPPHRRPHLDPSAGDRVPAAAHDARDRAAAGRRTGGRAPQGSGSAGRKRPLLPQVDAAPHLREEQVGPVDLRRERPPPLPRGEGPGGGERQERHRDEAGHRGRDGGRRGHERDQRRGPCLAVAPVLGVEPLAQALEAAAQPRLHRFHGIALTCPRSRAAADPLRSAGGSRRGTARRAPAPPGRGCAAPPPARPSRRRTASPPAGHPGRASHPAVPPTDASAARGASTRSRATTGGWPTCAAPSASRPARSPGRRPRPPCRPRAPRRPSPVRSRRARRSRRRGEGRLPCREAVPAAYREGFTRGERGAWDRAERL